MTLTTRLINTIIISTLPIGAFLYVPLKRLFVGIETPSTFFIISLLLSIFVIARSKEKKPFLIFALTCLISTYLLYNNNTSENLFLGKPLAHDITAETPGYTELTIYKNGIATIGYGGVFGISNEFFVSYGIKNDTITIFKDGEDFDLLNNSVFINQKRHHINFLTHKKILNRITN